MNVGSYRYPQQCTAPVHCIGNIQHPNEYVWENEDRQSNAMWKISGKQNWTIVLQKTREKKKTGA